MRGSADGSANGPITKSPIRNRITRIGGRPRRVAPRADATVANRQSPNHQTVVNQSIAQSTVPIYFLIPSAQFIATVSALYMSGPDESPAPLAEGTTNCGIRNRWPSGVTAYG